MNNGSMPNMITTPQNAIVTDFSKWLHYVVFENEGIFTDLCIMPNKRMRTYIRCEFITLFLKLRYTDAYADGSYH